jgi:hypothetical protein
MGFRNGSPLNLYNARLPQKSAFDRLETDKIRRDNISMLFLKLSTFLTAVI